MKFKIGDLIIHKADLFHRINATGLVISTSESTYSDKYSNKNKVIYVRVLWSEGNEWSYDSRELVLVENPDDILKSIL